MRPRSRAVRDQAQFTERGMKSQKKIEVFGTSSVLGGFGGSEGGPIPSSRFRTAVYCMVPSHGRAFEPASRGIGIVESHPTEKRCAPETLRVNSPASVTDRIFAT
jgi:hypothetical protein